MDRVTRAKIESMLYEVRSAAGHGPGSAARPALWDPDTLARRYQLDPMIVRALLESEGLVSGQPRAVDPDDPNQSTQVMSIDELGVV